MEQTWCRADINALLNRMAKRPGQEGEDTPRRGPIHFFNAEEAGVKELLRTWEAWQIVKADIERSRTATEACFGIWDAAHRMDELLRVPPAPELTEREALLSLLKMLTVFASSQNVRDEAKRLIRNLVP